MCESERDCVCLLTKLTLAGLRVHARVRFTTSQRRWWMTTTITSTCNGPILHCISRCAIDGVTTSLTPSLSVCSGVLIRFESPTRIVPCMQIPPDLCGRDRTVCISNVDYGNDHAIGAVAAAASDSLSLSTPGLFNRRNSE